MKHLLKWLALALVVLAGVPLKPAHAAQFEVIYISCPDDSENASEIARMRQPDTNCKGSADRLIIGHMVLRLTGDIALGDTNRLKKFLDDAIKSATAYGYDARGTYVTVEMAGEGGSVPGAIELGSFFRDRSVQTRIMRDATCAGPCALAFMGGQVRWTRLTRKAIDRRLEAGGKLIFRSPLFAPGTADPDKLRDMMQSVQTYAAKSGIPPLVLAKILGLKQNESFPIDNVFWAKLANITVDGVAAVSNPTDNNYISACLAQINWTYGLDGEYGEPPKIFDGTSWDEGEIADSPDKDKYVLIAVVFSYEGYDYWCAANKSRTEKVWIQRPDIRKILADWHGRNSLLHGDSDENFDLHGNEIYFSRASNGFEPTRAQNSLDFLMRDPKTKLAAIADPNYKWNPWTEADPWFEMDGP